MKRYGMKTPFCYSILFLLSILVVHLAVAQKNNIIHPGEIWPDQDGKSQPRPFALNVKTGETVILNK